MDDSDQTPETTSLEDPDWVDQIVARAFERVDHSEGDPPGGALDDTSAAEPSTSTSGTVDEAFARLRSLSDDLAARVGEAEVPPPEPEVGGAPAVETGGSEERLDIPEPVARRSGPPDVVVPEREVAGSVSPEVVVPDVVVPEREVAGSVSPEVVVPEVVVPEVVVPEVVVPEREVAGSVSPEVVVAEREAAAPAARVEQATTAPARPVGDEPQATRAAATVVTAERSVFDDGDPEAERSSSPDAEAERSDGDGEASDGKSHDRYRSIIEWAAVIGGALAVAFLIKTFLLQAFFIPSGSMEPTLNVGDRVLVNKLSYDFHGVNRGDLIVFGRPEGETGDVDDLIKRVIGLEGEMLEFRDGLIYIDDRRLEEPYLREGTLATGVVTQRAQELCDSGPTGTTCTVPDGMVFVMGDNRNESRDSRFFGPIEEDLIVGRAFLRVWPLTDIGFL